MSTGHSPCLSELPFWGRPLWPRALWSRVLGGACVPRKAGGAGCAGKTKGGRSEAARNSLLGGGERAPTGTSDPSPVLIGFNWHQREEAGPAAVSLSLFPRKPQQCGPGEGRDGPRACCLGHSLGPCCYRVVPRYDDLGPRFMAELQGCTSLCSRGLEVSFPEGTK